MRRLLTRSNLHIRVIELPLATTRLTSDLAHCFKIGSAPPWAGTMPDLNNACSREPVDISLTFH